MRALVLAGGEGSRLRPITHTSAKQLIPVANRPILFHALEDVAEAGITEVGIVVGHTEAEVRRAVGDGSAWGLRVTYLRQEAPLGLAHAVLVARDFLRGEPFVMYLGDNVLLEGIRRFVERFERHRPNAQIFLARVPEPERFGVAVLEGDRVVRLVEKPREHLSDLALVGVYLFDQTIVEAAAAIRPSWRNELEITDAIQHLIDTGRTVRAEMVQGWWKDTGRPEDLLEANRMLLSVQARRIEGEVDADSRVEGAVVVEAGAKVVRSELRGPAIVGQGSLVEDAVVGPHASISPGCTVTGSRIEDSIVMERCRVIGVRRLEGSILGRDVEVRGSAPPGAHRIVVGDQSRLELD
ncbi:MAG TPA: glucose-1-phosphate thymidylyltransferase [Actinomycetota bacterium]|nr:glucose-1-phosphate thymidylyltransferase [Actinomycetota bacterium]